MCGRFSLEEYPSSILEEFDLPTFPKYSAEKFVPKYNIAPSANILTLFKTENGHELAEMHWGLVPPWAKPGQFKQPLINARSETIWEKPSFRNLIKSNRCIIIANGFYEWNRAESPKQPYRIRLKDQQSVAQQSVAQKSMAMAGIYQVSKEGELQCCIVTMQANSDMASVHHRMPVIVENENMHGWLSAKRQDEVDDLVEEAAQTRFELIKVSPYVNNANNQSPECIVPM